MRATILLVLAAVVAGHAYAADIQLQQTVQITGQAPAGLISYSDALYAFDPMAGILSPVGLGETVALPPGESWTALVASQETIYALTAGGHVQQWSNSTATPVEWDVYDVGAIDFACGSVWLLYRSGQVERRDPGTGVLQSRWETAWPGAGKIHVSDALELVSLAPVQGKEVRLYDTSGVHLRTLEGPSYVRCADLALGTGGILAVADRFAGTVDLYGPLGAAIGRITERGTLAGQTLRPASLMWEGETLWILDPTLKRASSVTVTGLGENVLPVPLMVGPGAGSTFEADAIRFTVLPRQIVLEPNRIEIEVTTVTNAPVAHHNIALTSVADTLAWQPEVEWVRGGSYRWRVQAYSDQLKSGWSAWSHFDVAPLPQTFALLPNYPNPFNAATVIPFQVPDAQGRHTRITVYNVLGQQVRVLFDQQAEAGPQQVIWDGRNEDGTPVGSGVYFVRLTSDQGVLTRKAVLLK